MTTEDRDLLMKDLCGRLPYGVAVRVVGDWFEDEREPYDRIVKDDFSIISDFLRSGTLELRPYLRPMSSMTEKEFYELCELGVSLPPFKDYYGQMQYYGSGGEWEIIDVEIEDIIKYVNYLNAHYFDYNGLIEKGLALPAPEGMYKI